MIVLVVYYDIYPIIMLLYLKILGGGGGTQAGGGGGGIPVRPSPLCMQPCEVFLFLCCMLIILYLLLYMTTVNTKCNY